MRATTVTTIAVVAMSLAACGTPPQVKSLAHDSSSLATQLHSAMQRHVQAVGARAEASETFLRTHAARADFLEQEVDDLYLAFKTDSKNKNDLALYDSIATRPKPLVTALTKAPVPSMAALDKLSEFAKGMDDLSGGMPIEDRAQFLIDYASAVSKELDQIKKSETAADAAGATVK